MKGHLEMWGRFRGGSMPRSMSVLSTPGLGQPCPEWLVSDSPSLNFSLHQGLLRPAIHIQQHGYLWGALYQIAGER